MITGGGTGGHFSPAVAMAERFKKEGWKTAFVGSKIGIEAKLLSKYDFQYMLLNTSGFVGKSVKDKVGSLLKLMLSIVISAIFLRKLKTDCVVATGGFVCLPVSIAAGLIGIPVFVLEQNSVPGLANRIIGKFARWIFLNFPSSAKFFKKRWSICGNPVRNSIKQSVKGIKHKNKYTSVVVLGGSRGAKSINNAIIDMVEYVKKDNFLNIVCQTGSDGFDAVKIAYQGIKNIKIYRFIYDIEKIYGFSDLAVSRAGATTISELIYLRIPSIFVPYPYAAKNHQFTNANEIVKAGGAIIIEDDKLTGRLLYNTIKDFSTKLEQASEDLKKLSHEDTDIIIYKKISSLLTN